MSDPVEPQADPASPAVEMLGSKEHFDQIMGTWHQIPGRGVWGKLCYWSQRMATLVPVWTTTSGR
jgi:hypothetical protein